MARPFLPRNIAEITPEWLSTVLCANGGRILGFDAEPLGEGAGFMGETARLHLSWGDPPVGAPETIVAKLPSRDPVVRSQGQVLQIYEREVLVYRDFGRHEELHAPRCFLAALDERRVQPNEAEQIRRFVEKSPRWLLRGLLRLSERIARWSRRRYVLLLEDIPGRPGDQVAGCSPAELERILETAADFHAAFWEAADLDALHYVQPIDLIPRAMQFYYARGRDAFVARYEDKISPALLALADRIDVAIGAALERLCCAPFTLGHGDFRLDNLFLTTNDVTVIDWQVACEAPGVYDVAYLLTSTLGAGVSREVEDRYVAHYHAALMRHGIRDYPLDRCLADYRLAVLVLVHRVFSAIASLEIENARGVTLMDSWVERLDARVGTLTAQEVDAALR